MKSIRGDSSLLLSAEEPEPEALQALTWFPPGKAETGAEDHLCDRRRVYRGRVAFDEYLKNSFGSVLSCRQSQMKQVPAEGSDGRCAFAPTLVSSDGIQAI